MAPYDSENAKRGVGTAACDDPRIWYARAHRVVASMTDKRKQTQPRATSDEPIVFDEAAIKDVLAKSPPERLRGLHVQH